MKRIIYTRPAGMLDANDEGGVSVVTPNINTNEILTEEEAVQRAFDKLPAVQLILKSLRLTPYLQIVLLEVHGKKMKK